VSPDVDTSAEVDEPSALAASHGKVYRGSRHARPSAYAELARKIARGSGEALITFGLIVLLFAIYEVYGKTAAVVAHQNDLSKQLTQVWTEAPAGANGTAAPALPAPGGPLGRLYIPVLHMHWVVVEGVTLHDIQFAPGHYPGTALPGQIGNFSVAGHRVPSIFWNLQELQPGQLIVVETRDDWYEYQVTQNEIVTPHSVEVVAATPDHIGVAPTAAMMTLTTCNPKWDNYQRMAVHAILINKQAHSAGPPVALGS
jgi:sortase A